MNKWLEDRMVEITDMKQSKEKRMERNEDSVRDLWDTIKNTNIHIIRLSEGEERKYLRRLQLKTSLTWERKKITQVQEVQRILYKKNPRRNMPRHMLIKLVKNCGPKKN